MEIERKFLVDPAFAAGDGARLPYASSSDHRQGYLTDPSDSVEVRVAFRGAEAPTLTVKKDVAGAGGLERREVEVRAEAQASGLWALTEGRRVYKTRRALPVPAWQYVPLDEYGPLVFEVDTYRGDLDGLVVVEVEFPSARHAEAFAPPPWFGREVTSDPAYKNRSLAALGLPDEAL